MIEYHNNGTIKKIKTPELFVENWGSGKPRTVFKYGDGGYRKEYDMDGELVRHLRVINSDKEIVFNIINGA